MKQSNLQFTDWPAIIRYLNDRGISDTQLSGLVGCSQPSVTMIRRGQTKDPHYSIGREILAVYGQEKAKEQKETAEQKKAARVAG